MARVGQNHIYTVYIYGIFGREIIKYTIIYGVYIRFWPTLHMAHESRKDQITTPCLAILTSHAHTHTHHQATQPHDFCLTPYAGSGRASSDEGRRERISRLISGPTNDSEQPPPTSNDAVTGASSSGETCFGSRAGQSVLFV
jgi:hypothetical protein